jgi:O-methyltransferase domain
MTAIDPNSPEIETWMRSLEERHLANLRFAEVTRALRALSSAYVERRATLTTRGAYDSAGKRAAYALYYGPLHFLTVRAILNAVPELSTNVRHIADWGCGTGAGGAAWATAPTQAAQVSAIDVHAWALTEAAATYRTFSIDAEVRRGDVARARVPRSADALIAGWVLNELNDQTRSSLLPRFLDLAARGTRVLIVEPIATRVSPWWPAWATTFASAGGRADQWRFRVALPDLVRRLDRASGMRHDELTARSLALLPQRGRGLGR